VRTAHQVGSYGRPVQYEIVVDGHLGIPLISLAPLNLEGN
jgi:hypothetical protein